MTLLAAALGLPAGASADEPWGDARLLARHTEVRAVTATGRPGRIQRLSPRGESTLGPPSLAVGPRGDAIAAWQSTRGIRVARRPR